MHMGSGGKMIVTQEGNFIKELRKNCKHDGIIKYEELMRLGVVKPMNTILWQTASSGIQTIELVVCLICKRMMYIETEFKEVI